MKLLHKFLMGLFVGAAAETAAAANYSDELAAVAALGNLTNAPVMYVDDTSSTLASVAPGELKAVYFEGLDYLGSPTRVYAYVGIPAGASPGSPVPGVVLVHGGGGTAYSDWVQRWTSRGYAAISVAVEGQTDGNNPPTISTGWHRHAMPGPERIGIYGDSAVDPITDQWMYHAVADTVLANSLLRSLPEVTADDVGLMGISWGGVITSTAIGIDSRFRFAVPTYGCGNKDIAENVYGDVLSTDDLYKEVWDPMVRMTNAAMPVLWLSWPQEWHFPLYCQRDSYTNAPGERMVSLVPAMGHSHPAAWVRPESYDFADSIIGSGSPWCVQQGSMVSNGVAEVTFQSSKVLNNAVLISTLSSGLTADRVWAETAATLVDNGGGNYTLSAALPQYTTAWFINAQSGSLVVSSDFMETGVVGSNIVYSVTSNWSSRTVNPNDTVTVTNGATVTLDQGDDALELTLTDGATLQANQGVTLNVGGLVEVDNGALNQSAGIITATALTVNPSGALNLTGGELELTGLTINAGGLVDIDGGSLTKSSSSDIAGGGLLKLQSGAFTAGTDSTDGTTLKANVEISGGTFELMNQILIGSFGSGTYEFKVVGDDASITMRHLQFSAWTQSDSTLKWVLDETGVSTIHMTGWMFLDLAKIVVDGSAYTGGSKSIKLIDGVSLNGPAAASNITVTGFPETYSAEVVQDAIAGDVRLEITGGYDSWTSLYSLTGSDALPDADVEDGGMGDGLANLMEYALGGDPTNNDASAVAPIIFMGTDGLTNWFYHVHNERIDDPALSYSVGTATNLVTVLSWNTNDVVTVGESAIIDGFKSVTNCTTASEASRFMKLTVESK